MRSIPIFETFVNKEARREALIDTSTISPIIYKWAYSYLPGLNLLSLDFDSNVSEVNVVNRLLLFVEDLK